MGQQRLRASDGLRDVAAAKMRRIGEAHDEIDDHEGHSFADADGLGEALTGIDVELGQRFHHFHHNQPSGLHKKSGQTTFQTVR